QPALAAGHLLQQAIGDQRLDMLLGGIARGKAEFFGDLRQAGRAPGSQLAAQEIQHGGALGGQGGRIARAHGVHLYSFRVSGAESHAPAPSKHGHGLTPPLEALCGPDKTAPSAIQVRRSWAVAPALALPTCDALLFLCCIRGPAWLEVPIAQPRSPDKAKGRIRGPATLEMPIAQPSGNAQRVATRQPRSPDKAKGRIRGPATLEMPIAQPSGNAQRVATRQPRSPDKAKGRIRGPATLGMPIAEPSGNAHRAATRQTRRRDKA